MRDGRLRSQQYACRDHDSNELGLHAQTSNQNKIFTPSCTWRDALVVRSTWPAVASGASFCVAPANTGLLGTAKFARLSTLNTSNLNCSFVSPFNDWFFTSEASTFAKPGPRRKFRGVL